MRARSRVSRGRFYASFLGLVDPSAMGVSLSIDLLLMVVLGGAGGVAGAIARRDGHRHRQHLRPQSRKLASGHLWRAGHRDRHLLPRAAWPDSFRAARAASHAKRRRTSRPPEPPPPLRFPLRAPESAPWLTVESATEAFRRPGRRRQRLVRAGKRNAHVADRAQRRGQDDPLQRDLRRRPRRRRPRNDRRARRDRLEPHRIAALGVGRSFQNARLFGDMTVLENVVAGAFVGERATFVDDLLRLAASRRSGRDARERARTRVRAISDLEHLTGRFRARSRVRRPPPRRTRARARCDPGLLLVDEPAAGLNASERARLRDDLLRLRDAA